MAVTFSVKSEDGRLISNLSVAEVKRLFDEGKINDHDMISKDGTGQWHPARKYKGASSKNNSSQSQQPSTSVSVSSLPKPENNIQEVKIVAADNTAQRKPEEEPAALLSCAEEPENQVRSISRESKTNG